MKEEGGLHREQCLAHNILNQRVATTQTGRRLRTEATSLARRAQVHTGKNATKSHEKKPEWPLLHRAPPTASEGVVTGPVTDRAAPTEGRGSRPRVRVALRATVCAECTVAAMGEPAQYRMALGMPSRDVMASRGGDVTRPSASSIVTKGSSTVRPARLAASSSPN